MPVFVAIAAGGLVGYLLARTTHPGCPGPTVCPPLPPGAAAVYEGERRVQEELAKLQQVKSILRTIPGVSGILEQWGI